MDCSRALLRSFTLATKVACTLPLAFSLLRRHFALLASAAGGSRAQCYQTEPHLERFTFFLKQGRRWMASLFLLVRVTGLEPVRRGHTPLKRACLPIPAHSQIKPCYYSI